MEPANSQRGHPDKMLVHISGFEGLHPLRTGIAYWYRGHYLYSIALTPVEPQPFASKGKTVMSGTLPGTAPAFHPHNTHLVAEITVDAVRKSILSHQLSHKEREAAAAGLAVVEDKEHHPNMLGKKKPAYDGYELRVSAMRMQHVEVNTSFPSFHEANTPAPAHAFVSSIPCYHTPHDRGHFLAESAPGSRLVSRTGSPFPVADRAISPLTLDPRGQRNLPGAAKGKGRLHGHPQGTSPFVSQAPTRVHSSANLNLQSQLPTVPVPGFLNQRDTLFVPSQVHYLAQIAHSSAHLGPQQPQRTVSVPKSLNELRLVPSQVRSRVPPSSGTIPWLGAESSGLQRTVSVPRSLNELRLVPSQVRSRVPSTSNLQGSIPGLGAEIPGLQRTVSVPRSLNELRLVPPGELHSRAPPSPDNSPRLGAEVPGLQRTVSVPRALNELRLVPSQVHSRVPPSSNPQGNIPGLGAEIPGLGAQHRTTSVPSSLNKTNALLAGSQAQASLENDPHAGQFLTVPGSDGKGHARHGAVSNPVSRTPSPLAFGGGQRAMSHPRLLELAEEDGLYMRRDPGVIGENRVPKPEPIRIALPDEDPFGNPSVIGRETKRARTPMPPIPLPADDPFFEPKVVVDYPLVPIERPQCRVGYRPSRRDRSRLAYEKSHSNPYLLHGRSASEIPSLDTLLSINGQPIGGPRPGWTVPTSTGPSYGTSGPSNIPQDQFKTLPTSFPNATSISKHGKARFVLNEAYNERVTKCPLHGGCDGVSVLHPHLTEQTRQTRGFKDQYPTITRGEGSERTMTDWAKIYGQEKDKADREERRVAEMWVEAGRAAMESDTDDDNWY